jgi:hypothetical protein
VDASKYLDTSRQNAPFPLTTPLSLGERVNDRPETGAGGVKR